FFFFLAAYFLLSGRDRAAFLSALPTLAMKEDAALTLFALGVFAFLVLKRKRSGLALAITSGAWAVLTVFIVMPLARHGATGDLAARYSELADTPLSWFGL